MLSCPYLHQKNVFKTDIIKIFHVKFLQFSSIFGKQKILLSVWYLKVEFLFKLHFLRSPESDNLIFCSLSVCSLNTPISCRHGRKNLGYFMVNRTRDFMQSSKVLLFQGSFPFRHCGEVTNFRTLFHQSYSRATVYTIFPICHRMTCIRDDFHLGWPFAWETLMNGFVTCTVTSECYSELEKDYVVPKET